MDRRQKCRQKGGVIINGKALNNLEANKVLNMHGFYRVRTSGSHAIYKDMNGRTFTITAGKPLSQKTWKRECKKVGIEV